MKSDLVSIRTVLIAALGTTLLAGCATPTGDYSQGNLGTGEVRSQLSVTPVTSLRELSKWSQYQSSLKAIPQLRSIETYAFAAPAGTETAAGTAFVTTMPPGTIFVEPAGAEAAGYAVFLHTPGQR